MGADLAKLSNHYCGGRLPDEDRRCSNCGKLSDDRYSGVGELADSLQTLNVFDLRPEV
jgi:hypothetical protein